MSKTKRRDPCETLDGQAFDYGHAAVCNAYSIAYAMISGTPMTRRVQEEIHAEMSRVVNRVVGNKKIGVLNVGDMKLILAGQLRCVADMLDRS